MSAATDDNPLNCGYSARLRGINYCCRTVDRELRVRGGEHNSGRNRVSGLAEREIDNAAAVPSWAVARRHRFIMTAYLWKALNWPTPELQRPELIGEKPQRWCRAKAKYLWCRLLYECETPVSLRCTNALVCCKSDIYVSTSCRGLSFAQTLETDANASASADEGNPD